MSDPTEGNLRCPRCGSKDVTCTTRNGVHAHECHDCHNVGAWAVPKGRS